MIGSLNQSIGARLRYVRETAGVSTERMAEILQVSVPHYRKIERGVYELKTDKLVVLFEELGADPLFLLTGEERARLDVGDDYKPAGGRELRVMQDLFRYCRTVSEEPEQVVRVQNM